MNRKFLHLLIDLCFGAALLLLAGCRPVRNEDNSGFAIHQINEEITPDELLESDVGDLTLLEPPVIATADIISYNTETHEMRLTDEAFDRVKKLFKGSDSILGKPFVAVVDQQPIYAGVFWSMIFSRTFDGVVFMQPVGDEPVVYISLDYPSLDAFTGEDQRSDARILDSLESAGKLEQ